MQKLAATAIIISLFAGCIATEEAPSAITSVENTSEFGVSANRTTAKENSFIQFEATLDGDTLAAVSWDFGDGTGAPGNPISHRFKAGSYDVVATGHGNNGTYTARVAVQILDANGNAPETTSSSSSSSSASSSSSNEEQNETSGPRPFEPQEPKGSCSSLDVIAPTSVDPTGLANGWPLLELDVAMIADPLFANNNESWQQLLHELVADASIYYEEQLGIRLNVSLMARLPNGTLEPGTGDGKQRSTARGFLVANHPNAEWDFVAVILGGDYEGTTAGMVECVHGLGVKDYAYLWSEYDQPREKSELLGTPVGLIEDMPLKVFMHEAAHLLAAHHHYTNCVVPYIDLRLSDALGACGVMINDIGLASFRFSETNKLVMRSYVEETGAGSPI